jgi:hypothetical protein
LTGFLAAGFFFLGAALRLGLVSVAVFRVVLLVVVVFLTAAAVASARIKHEVVLGLALNRESRAGLVRWSAVLTDLVRLDDDDVLAVAKAKRTKAEAITVIEGDD